MVPDTFSSPQYLWGNPVELRDPNGFAAIYQTHQFVPGRGVFNATLGTRFIDDPSNKKKSIADTNGADMSITFLPNDSVKKGCKCDYIDFVQYYWDKYYFNGYIGGVDSGWGGTDPNWETDHGDPYTKGTNNPWQRGVSNIGAEFSDSPGADNATDYTYWDIKFKTEAICRKSNSGEAGKSYGMVEWEVTFKWYVSQKEWRLTGGTPTSDTGLIPMADTTTQLHMTGYVPTH